MFVPTYFNATAQSIVDMGRTLTETEISACVAKKEELLTAGVQGNFPLSVNNVWTYYWSTTAAADQYVALCQTFTPPPVSSVVNAV